MVSGGNCLGSSRKEHRHDARLELVRELKLTDVGDRIWVASERLYQELIDAEAAAFGE